jgi:hypothetical protein
MGFPWRKICAWTVYEILASIPWTPSLISEFDVELAENEDGNELHHDDLFRSELLCPLVEYDKNVGRVKLKLIDVLLVAKVGS